MAFLGRFLKGLGCVYIKSPAPLRHLDLLEFGSWIYSEHIDMGAQDKDTRLIFFKGNLRRSPESGSNTGTWCFLDARKHILFCLYNFKMAEFSRRNLLATRVREAPRYLSENYGLRPMRCAKMEHHTLAT